MCNISDFEMNQLIDNKTKDIFSVQSTSFTYCGYMPDGPDYSSVWSSSQRCLVHIWDLEWSLCHMSVWDNKHDKPEARVYYNFIRI